MLLQLGDDRRLLPLVRPSEGLELAVGFGVRYRTPIGPIRFDFAVNLDPPYYPIYVTYSSSSNPVNTPPHIGRTGYFNFFFSIGQAF